jgi:hypothetical protein
VRITSGPAALSVKASLDNPFEDTVLNTTRSVTLTFTNSGGMSATDLMAPVFERNSFLQYQGGEYPGQFGTCGAELSGQQSCTIVLSFTPTIAGSYSYDFTLNFVDGVERQTLVKSFTANAGTVAFLEVESGFDPYFGVVEPGDIKEKTITIINRGGLKAFGFTSLLSGSGSYFFKGFIYPGTGGSCGSVLLPGESCRLVVNYMNLLSGSTDASLLLGYNNSLTQEGLIISFNAISAEIAAVLQVMGITKYEFGPAPIGKSILFQAKIANSGFFQASNINLSVPSPYQIISSNCATLEIAQTCDIEVTFTPDATGLAESNLIISYHNGKRLDERNFPLTGTGLQPGTVAFKDTFLAPMTQLDFGIIGMGAKATRTILVKNEGNFSFSNFTFSSLPSEVRIVSNLCSSTILKNGTCSFQLEFTPDSLGEKNLAINISYFNGATTTSASLTLVADVMALGLLTFLSPSPLDLGIIQAGTTSTRLISVKNVGINDALNISFSGLNGVMGYEGGGFPGTTGNCPAAGFTLHPGESCSIALSLFSASSVNSFVDFVATYDNSSFVTSSQMRFIFSIRQDGRLEVEGADSATQSFANIADGASVSFGPYSWGNKYLLTLNIGNNGEMDALEIQYGLSNTNGFSFVGVTGRNCSQGMNLANRSNCLIGIEIELPSTGVHSTTLTFNYNGEFTTNQTMSITIAATGANMPYLVAPATSLNFGATALNGSNISVLTYRNDGQANAPITAKNYPSNGYSVIGDTCGTSIAANSECSISVAFTPTIKKSYSSIMSMSVSDTVYSYTFATALTGVGADPALLIISDGSTNSETDYDLVVINQSKPITYTLRNIGGVTATSISLSGVLAPFSVTQNPCGTLNSGASCTFQISFTPPEWGVRHSNDLSLSYYNGAAWATPTIRTIIGTGEPPLSTHNGWSEIYAIGDKVDINSLNSTDRMVRLSWNAMTSSVPLDGYQVFRRTANEATFNFTLPLATLPLGLRTFTDTSIVPGTIYYYVVRATIEGFPSRSTQSFAEVRVVAPPDNMALVHRWMVNQDICGRMSKSIDRSNNHRCPYDGVAKTIVGLSSFYDIGHDLLVDRFELGQDITSRPNQLPIQSLGQTHANMACGLQPDIFLAGSGSSYKKRLLSRREWVAASSWESSLSHATILSRETTGTTASSSCNGPSGTALEKTGFNTNCVSRYGIMDMAGNGWEWTNERILDGRGFVSGGAIPESNFKLDIDNDDLDGVSFQAFDSNNFMFNLNCISVPLRLPLSNSASCSDGAFAPHNLPSGGAAGLYNSYYYAPQMTGAMFLLAGGGFGSTNASVYTSAWLPFNFANGGARCGFPIP